jgi:mono/diheme cytochrome c family protein
MKANRSSAAAVIASASLLLVAVTAGRASGPDAAAANAADPVPALMKSPADVDRGRALFVGTCGAYCHHMTPGPGDDAPYLFDCDWLHGGSDAAVFHTITTGVPNTRMVAFGGAIPDQDIWRIVAYLKSASTCGK